MRYRHSAYPRPTFAPRGVLLSSDRAETCPSWEPHLFKDKHGQRCQISYKIDPGHWAILAAPMRSADSWLALAQTADPCALTIPLMSIDSGCRPRGWRRILRSTGQMLAQGS